MTTHARNFEICHIQTITGTNDHPCWKGLVSQRCKTKFSSCLPFSKHCEQLALAFQYKLRRVDWNITFRWKKNTFFTSIELHFWIHLLTEIRWRKCLANLVTHEAQSNGKSDLCNPCINHAITNDVCTDGWTDTMCENKDHIFNRGLVGQLLGCWLQIRLFPHSIPPGTERKSFIVFGSPSRKLLSVLLSKDSS